MSKKILIIEDDQSIRESLKDGLTLEGYEVLCCENGSLGLETFDSEKPDLVILDLIMPEIDGLEVCKRIRAKADSIPVIMLTAKDNEIDKVVGLELGADDYLTKPFGMRELAARIKALLRRSAPAQPKEEELSEIEFSGVRIDFKSYRAWKKEDSSETEFSMSAKEFEIIKFLAKQPDVPVTRNDLLNQVWGYDNYPTTRTVDNFIARIRNKIEPTPDSPKHLVTVHGVGYKFVL